jgi:hypothetical protein
MEDIQLTVLRNLRGPLSKSIFLKDGKLVKTSAATLAHGVAVKRAISGLHDLVKIIDGLTVEEALTFGVCRFDVASVVTQKMLAKQSGKNVVCRDSEHFKWPDGRGVLMLDLDAPKDGSEPLKALEFDAIMSGLHPWWPTIARTYKPSASAFIYDKVANLQLTGAGSIRCYAIVDIAQNVPYVGVNIVDAFWRAGHGRIEFSACGSQLVRCPVDASVWQPERLDFAGPVVLGDGLEKRNHPPVAIPGSDIDSEAVMHEGIGDTSFSEWSKLSIDVRRAKLKNKPEETRRKEITIEKRAREDAAKGEDIEEARRKHRAALMEGALSGSIPLYFEDGETATVERVLEDPGRYDGRRLLDPEAPEYSDDKRIAIFYANKGSSARPYIYSHAHGGRTFALMETSPFTLSSQVNRGGDACLVY